jgi:hypothetical protein
MDIASCSVDYITSLEGMYACVLWFGILIVVEYRYQALFYYAGYHHYTWLPIPDRLKSLGYIDACMKAICSCIGVCTRAKSLECSVCLFIPLSLWWHAYYDVDWRWLL